MLFKYQFLQLTERVSLPNTLNIILFSWVARNQHFNKIISLDINYLCQGISIRDLTHLEQNNKSRKKFKEFTDKHIFFLP